MKEKFKDKQEELVFLRDWTITILKVFQEVRPNATSYEEMIIIVERVFEMNDLRAMRLAYGDVNEMAVGESCDSVETARLLNKALREKFAMDLCDVNKKKLSNNRPHNNQDHLKDKYKQKQEELVFKLILQ